MQNRFLLNRIATSSMLPGKNFPENKAVYACSSTKQTLLTGIPVWSVPVLWRRDLISVVDYHVRCGGEYRLPASTASCCSERKGCLG